MARLPHNIGQFGIAGLGASPLLTSISNAPQTTNIGNRMNPVYVNADATPAERIAAFAKQNQTISTPAQVKPTMPPPTGTAPGRRTVVGQSAPGAFPVWAMAVAGVGAAALLLLALRRR